MSVRVIHAANEGTYHLAGINVGAVRKSLREVFNIPEAAAAFIGGVPVLDGRVIVDGETLEFIREQGLKGVGALLTPSELREAWHISEGDYEELLVLGLPLVRLASGIRHPEAAVDEFFKHLGDPRRSSTPELVGSPYVADRLGCSTVWITDLVRRKEIPPSCVVPGTGNGKPWKFVRVRIDEWLRRR